VQKEVLRPSGATPSITMPRCSYFCFSYLVERESEMCMTCGCGEPHDDHGDRRNLTYDAFKKAADASKISVKEAVKNIGTTFRTRRPRSRR
jgi:hypothetical protein